MDVIYLWPIMHDYTSRKIFRWVIYLVCKLEIDCNQQKTHVFSACNPYTYTVKSIWESHLKIAAFYWNIFWLHVKKCSPLFTNFWILETNHCVETGSSFLAVIGPRNSKTGDMRATLFYMQPEKYKNKVNENISVLKAIFHIKIGWNSEKSWCLSHSWLIGSN